MAFIIPVTYWVAGAQKRQALTPASHIAIKGWNCLRSTSSTHNTSVLLPNHTLENKQPLGHYVNMQCHVELKLLNLLGLDLIPPVRWNADHFHSCVTPEIGSMNANLLFTKIQRGKNIAFDLMLIFLAFPHTPMCC